MKTTKKQNKGFAAMKPELQKEIAKKGGKAVSANRVHMSEIGRLGGEASGRNRRAKLQKGEDKKSEA